MASKSYPNNACCYDVSWDNVPRTASLCAIQNLVFFVIWAWDLQFFTIVSNLLIIYIIFISGQKLFVPQKETQESSSRHIDFYTKLFELSYEKINNAFDWFRTNSRGTKGVVLVICLYGVQLLNISMFGLAFIISSWSYAEPAMMKFLGVNLRELYLQYKDDNPLVNKASGIYRLIPKASSLKKNS